VPYVKCVLAGIVAVCIGALALVAWQRWEEYEINKSMPRIHLVHIWVKPQLLGLLIFSLLVFAAGFGGSTVGRVRESCSSLYPRTDAPDDVPSW